MSETVITVHGQHVGRFEPEHAVVTATVSFDGPDRAAVFERATGAAAELTAGLGELHDPDAGPVTRWSAERARVWSQRPWNEQGAQLDPVYYAQLGITATFVDTEALARWVEQAATSDGVAIAGIAWGLSEERERTALAQVRAAAVTDALERARAYATSLGLAELTPVAIADPGMLGDRGGGPTIDAMPVGAMRAMKEHGGAELAFTPGEIELSAAVDARFTAR